ncbi:MAG: hypothetical protein HZB70_02035 [Candidatus Berkelbacteria bacterium]|nr:MAG: hypothetical protein HZB70_02035 [Candidatus Berkelbacteria bacterium]QQG51899.1 MAG: hypothetical protein HY845_00960 [Candidatus Berkelbacteria bacterium]
MSRSRRTPEQTQALIKTIRNTVFTGAVVVLTGAGVAWNKQSAAQREPISIAQTVLAEAGNSSRQDFKLKLELSRKVMKLGQYQVVTVTALPFAELNIVAAGSNGNYERPETRQVNADETGRYSYRFKVSDFHDIGLFRITVHGSVNRQTASAEESFTVQAWGKDDEKNDFVYPLLP